MAQNPKIHPAPLPTIPENGKASNRAVQNNFIEPTETMYFFLAGSTETFIHEIKDHTKSLTLFEKVSLDINKHHVSRGFIPNTNFFDSEEKAFLAAKEVYPQHAVSIFKLNIPLSQFHLGVAKVDNKILEVARPNLNKYLESIKSVSTLNDSVETLKSAKVFEKSIVKGKPVFTESGSSPSPALKK
jgi:hypothetical protein